MDVGCGYSKVINLNINLNLYFPREQVIVKLGEKKLILIEAPFIEEVSGMAIVKIIDQGQKTPMMLKLKFIRNKATLDITNNTRDSNI